jgi:two-component system, chemotaxis family, protein-glutamate methylesterase/glutaminase
VLAQMPADAPGIVITQHIPAAFSAPFAERMNRCSAMLVCEAQDGQQVRPGHAYIAPGGRHLHVVSDGARWVCRLSDEAPVNRHRPSVDVLFRSVARHAGKNAVAALLTGMGDDGARGLLELRQAGARTLIQDEASSVVWGMPGAAFKLGAAEQVLPLDQIAGALLAMCS